MIDKAQRFRVLAILSAMLLVGCGGGGSGSSATDATALFSAQALAELTPTQLKFVANEGEVPIAVLRVKRPHWADWPQWKNFTDSENLVDTRRAWGDPVGDAPAGTTSVYVFRFTDKAVPGTRSGTIDIAFPCTLGTNLQCPSTVERRTVRVPYVLTVHPDSGAKTPLKELPGAPPWRGFQGNGARTGFVPATVDAANFSRRFVLRTSTTGDPTSSATRFDPLVAAVGGRIMLRGDRKVASPEPSLATLLVLENSGLAEWQSKVVQPPAAGTQVESATTLNLYALNQWVTAGVTLSAYGNDRCRWVDLGASVLTACGGSAGDFVARFGVGQNLIDWKVKFAGPGELDDSESWPAVSDGTVYFKGVNALYARSIVDGSLRFQVSSPSGMVYKRGSSPVIGADGSIFVTFGDSYGRNHSNTLARIDPATRRIDWTRGTTIESVPVLAGDVLYVIDDTRLVALEPATGRELWAWQSPWWSTDWASSEGRLAPLVVVGDYAIFNSIEGVRALDLRTRTIAWGDPSRGELAVSDSGVLYVVSVDRVTAINLQ